MSDRIQSLSFLPTTAVLELTYRCNHHCLFCSCPWEDKEGPFVRKAELTTIQWKAIITRLCGMGISNFAFTGGEPLQREDLFEIIAHAASCQTEQIETIDNRLVSTLATPHLSLLSNGRSVNESVLEMCHNYGVQLSMSLPGLDTFECHTGFDGADKVLSSFTTAKSYGLRTVANVTVTKLNLSELHRVVAAALLAGAEQILLNRFLPGGRGLRFAKMLALSARDLIEMLDVTENALEAAGRLGSLGTEVPRCVVDPSRYTRLQVSTRCSAALQFFVVGPSGFIRVCNHSPINLDHVNDISALKKNDYWAHFTQKRYLPLMCNDCEQRTDCDGGCREAAHIVNGSLDSPDILL